MWGTKLRRKSAEDHLQHSWSLEVVESHSTLRYHEIAGRLPAVRSLSTSRLPHSWQNNSLKTAQFYLSVQHWTEYKITRVSVRASVRPTFLRPKLSFFHLTFPFPFPFSFSFPFLFPFPLFISTFLLRIVMNRISFIRYSDVRLLPWFLSSN